MVINPTYEISLTGSTDNFNRIELNEVDYTSYDLTYIYSGLTHTLTYSSFTSYLDIIDHHYRNTILNNDIYTYTGITGETHYFSIGDFYLDTPVTIDPLQSGYTESNIITGFTTNVLPCVSNIHYPITGCCPTQVIKSNLPWIAITTDNGNCEDFISRRPNKGWTLDFVFNKNGIDEWKNAPFFYTGVRDEYDPYNYADNNLSFSFTEDGRIKWVSYQYDSHCDDQGQRVDDFLIRSGITSNPLCLDGTSTDFNITIVFERYFEYGDCDLPNEGGWNDLVNTGITSTTGSTIVIDEQIETLGDKWLKERSKRLGVLKIYHNGRPLEVEVEFEYIPNLIRKPVYGFKNWEEIILSDRGYQPFTHVVGGGVTGCEGIHEGVLPYTIKYAAYFESPMSFHYLRNRYITITKENFNITECSSPCGDDVHPL